jgi:hypothetical protein
LENTNLDEPRPCANRDTSEEVNGDDGAICEIKLRFDCINVFG